MLYNTLNAFRLKKMVWSGIDPLTRVNHVWCKGSILSSSSLPCQWPDQFGWAEGGNLITSRQLSSSTFSFLALSQQVHKLSIWHLLYLFYGYSLNDFKCYTVSEINSLPTQNQIQKVSSPYTFNEKELQARFHIFMAIMLSAVSSRSHFLPISHRFT